VLIDDLIATGGTMMAGMRLLERPGRDGDRRRGDRRPAELQGLAEAAGLRAAGCTPW
jgi:hypothetical protein